VQQVIEIFQGTNVNITSEGRKHLGAAVVLVKHKENHVNGLVQKWVRELSLIALIAKSQPQCAYAIHVGIPP